MMLGPEGLVPSELDEDMEARDSERAASFLAFVQKTADVAGVPCETIMVKGMQPYDAIVDAANDRGCDLIVMTSRHRKGLVSMLLGSEASRVLHRASIPVLTFRALMSTDHPEKQITPS